MSAKRMPLKEMNILQNKMRITIMPIALSAVFLGLLGCKLFANNENNLQYPASDQIAARFIDTGATLEKTDVTPSFSIDANYDTYTDGSYNYFVDTDDHVVRLIEPIDSLSSNATTLKDRDLDEIATNLFHKAYGYDLTGELKIVNYGPMGDVDSTVTIEVSEKINEVETGNKGIIILFPDGSLSRATFFPGLKPNEIATIDKSKMISEEAAKELALEAVKDKEKATYIEIIESGDSPYSAEIQRHDDTTFWTIEFTAEFIDDSGKEQQAFFGVQIEVYTGRILIVYSSIY